MYKKIFIFLPFLGALLLASCNNSDIKPAISKDDLELIGSYPLNIMEPSGLAIDETGTFLYTVSDNTGHIYKISTDGVLLKTYVLGGDDLEGVSVYKDGKLLLAEERKKQVLVYDLSTGTTMSYFVNYENNSLNSGMEGVAYKSNDGSTFVLNEKDPGKLIRLRADFSIIAEYELGFATDYSGIFYDISTNKLWILSDERKTLNKCTLTGDLIKSFSINITQAEGLAITDERIYIVSDAESKLYVYKKPLE